MRNKDKAGYQGVPANAIIRPLEISLAVLLMLIIVLVFEVNRSSNELSDLMERSGTYMQEASNLQAGINTLSETASSFIQNPVTGDGATNVGPLNAYVEELGKDRRGPEIAERFRAWGVGADIQQAVDEAAETSVTMMDIQAHAIALMSSVYALPPIPALSALPEYTLGAEEQALPEEARIGQAKQLLLGSDYSQMKHIVADNANTCSELLQKDLSRAAAETRQHVAGLRLALWIVIAAVAGMLIFAFCSLRVWMVSPLREHVREINADENMKQLSNVREMRVLATAYNTLLNRRNKLEGILRAAAETDALTGLANRYSMEQYALEAGEDDSAMAVLVFDVNFLKQINDSEGHLMGDRLIRTAGECICECFAGDTRDNCFRIGGDEFIAVLRGCSEEEVKNRLTRFSLALERENISISVGYAYTPKTDEDSFRSLLTQADARMYEEKKRFHEQKGISIPPAK